MRIESRAVENALKMLPARQRKYIKEAIKQTVQQGVALARTMAPKDTGELAAGIHGKVEFRSHDLVGSIEAAPKGAESQIKARAVEFGRKNARSKKGTRLEQRSKRGTTEAVPFIRRAQQIIGPKHKGRITRAMNKAAKELSLK